MRVEAIPPMRISRFSGFGFLAYNNWPCFQVLLSLTVLVLKTSSRIEHSTGEQCNFYWDTFPSPGKTTMSQEPRAGSAQPVPRKCDCKGFINIVNCCFHSKRNQWRGNVGVNFVPMLTGQLVMGFIGRKTIVGNCGTVSEPRRASISRHLPKIGSSRRQDFAKP